MRLLMLSLVSIVATTSIAVATQEPQPPPGKVPFTRVCAACHGANASGGQGPAIVNVALEYDEFLANVRHSGGEMPSFSKDQISDDEVQQVFEFLKSL